MDSRGGNDGFAWARGILDLEQQSAQFFNSATLLRRNTAMPLVIILLIGILAFGLFDFILGRSQPVTAVQDSLLDGANRPAEHRELPSIHDVAASQVIGCHARDTACQLVALYRFVLTTVNPEPRQSPWLHPQQHPARTLHKNSGDATDIAILFSSLLDQQHIRNYVIVLPQQSYVLACDITPSALRQAGPDQQSALQLLEPQRIAIATDQTTIQATERMDAYGLNIGDAPCPCLLLDPSGPISHQPGDPMPLSSSAIPSALDLMGHRHALVSSDR